MTPSWPRLATEMHLAEAPTARGSWRTLEDGVEREGTFVSQAGEIASFDAAGEFTEQAPPAGLWSSRYRRGNDYHRPLGPAVAVEQAGRPCWQVELVPPGRKSGLLRLVIDDATSLCLLQANDEHGLLREIRSLDLHAVVDEQELAPLRLLRREAAELRALYDLVEAHPPPTPRWFPWRRTFHDHGGALVVPSLQPGYGAVHQVSDEAAVPDSFFDATSHPVLAEDGQQWMVTSETPMSADDAEEVIRQVRRFDAPA